MRNASGSIAALLILAALAAVAGPALCGTAQADAMPCCKEMGDCGQGLGRPSCCVDLPAEGATPSPQSAAAAATLFAAAVVPATADAPAPTTTIASEATAIAFASDSPPLFLLHSVFLC